MKELKEWHFSGNAPANRTALSEDAQTRLYYFQAGRIDFLASLGTNHALNTCAAKLSTIIDPGIVLKAHCNMK